MYDFDNPFISGKPPRRKHVYYWDNNGERVSMLYSRWLWLWCCGEIPDGYVIHHKDKDKCHDVITNLECLSTKEHGLRHRGDQKHIIVAPQGMDIENIIFCPKWKLEELYWLEGLK